MTDLSGRQKEILALVARGLTDREIARELWLTPHTVANHLQLIYHELGARNRIEALREVGMVTA